MLRLAGTVLLLTTVCAQAQQAPTPNEQALATKLMYELQQGLSCATNTLVVQAELAKANAKIKELEAKKEPDK